MTLHVLAGDRLFDLALSTAEAADILHVCPDTVRRRCVDGVYPLMPRHGDAPWRIPTAKLFDVLGLAHELVTVPPATPVVGTISGRPGPVGDNGSPARRASLGRTGAARRGPAAGAERRAG